MKKSSKKKRKPELHEFYPVIDLLLANAQKPANEKDLDIIEKTKRMIQFITGEDVSKMIH